MKQLFRNAAMLLLFCICGSAHAQMKVESFNVMEKDIDASVNFSMADKTASKKNQLCAIIKVVTTEMDCSFDIGSLEIAKVVRKPEMSEVWVYVPVGTKMIKISHPRQGQLDTEDGYFYFKEIGKCKSGTVYRLKLHTEFHPDNSIIKDPNKFANVEFAITPKNATLALGSTRKRTDADGKIVSDEMQLGIYPFRISADNYYDYDGKVELDKEGETKKLSFNLRQAFGWAVLPADFDLTGCQFTVNDKPCEVTGNKVAVPSGQQKLHISKTYYYPEDVEVSITDSADSPLSPTLRPILGKLMVNTPDLPGSTIRIDGKEFGTTPFAAAKDIIIGKHTIEVSRPNYVSQTREVEIAEGQAATESFSLSSKGNFNVTSTPIGASLYLNSEYIGITPCAMENLPSGTYDIKIEKKKYRTIERKVPFDAAKPNNVFKMSRQYQQKNQFYIQPTFQTIAYNSVGIGLGGYISNVNIEADFLNGLSSEEMYWNCTDKDEIPRKEKLKSMWIGGKIGYGIITGTRLRITPQLGGGHLMIKGDGSASYAINASVGARVDFAIANHFGIVLAPEYSFPIVKSDTYSRIADISSMVKGWSNGFNLRIGINIFF